MIIANHYVITFKYRYGIDYHQTILDSVYCSSSQYLNILQCTYSTFPSCLRDSSDLYVICCKLLIVMDLCVIKLL